MNAAITASNIVHKVGEVVPGQTAVTCWSPAPGIQYSARWNAEKVLNGSSIEEWDAQWNSTWAMKNDTWTQVDFEEAKRLEAEVKSGSGEEEKKTKGKGKVWNRYSGKNAGSRSFA